MGKTFASLPGYEVVGRIGRGAHAIIYRARERSTRQEIALKHVIRRNADDEKFLKQAETEYEVAHRFEHPFLRRCVNIVRVRKWLKTLELFLLMEYVEGETLEQRYADTPTGRFETVTETLRQVAEGLHAMHRLGHIHADIKPNNILLPPGGGVKIIDFGQSCEIGHRKERIQGTPDYIAPEQVQRGVLDQRTDVFNLGATFYWVLTGKAFKTALPTAMPATKKIELDARRGNEPPHELNPGVPLPLSRLIMDCCETSPSDRPRDMKQLISRLETIEHLLARQRGDAEERAAATAASEDRTELSEEALFDGMDDADDSGAPIDFDPFEGLDDPKNLDTFDELRADDP